ncbi:triose-phosphate isomerase [bacterium]|jgi:triosephosphate isomerase (TIM)|nr:triose-phosphate isomerase [bacterium]
MRKPIIAANWKMNKTIKESQLFMQKFLFDYTPISCDIVICPPVTALSSVGSIISGSSYSSSIKLGTQNCHWEEKGAYTGEVSLPMLKEFSVNSVIIGHSERRQYFSETNQTVNKKLKAIYSQNLRPIFCIGESLEQREAGNTFTVLSTQLNEGLDDISITSGEDIVIAYEPIWAIGTGNVATPKQIQAVHSFIRETLSVLFSPSIASAIRIQYGGSVKPSNIESIMQLKDVDGALVGGASLEPDDFMSLIQIACKAKEQIRS